MQYLGDARVGDIAVGICSIGADCCPHSWVGIWTIGSRYTTSDSREQIRVGDIGITTCPHCPIMIAVTGCKNAVSEDRDNHRCTDICIVACGIGTTITCSDDVTSC